MLLPNPNSKALEHLRPGLSQPPFLLKTSCLLKAPIPHLDPQQTQKPKQKYRKPCNIHMNRPEVENRLLHVVGEMNGRRSYIGGVFGWQAGGWGHWSSSLYISSSFFLFLEEILPGACKSSNLGVSPIKPGEIEVVK
mmetsp:Transcript_21775/g.34397  ORF Transcript_21775/g.34397 Transcript_21775/m.34397 type:complete len:137 (+) Transcript_21775:1342-1752(+)